MGKVKFENKSHKDMMETMSLKKLKTLRRQVSLELEENLIPFWLEHVKDDGRKDFTGKMSNQLVKEPASKGLVLHARLLWTFSRLYRFYHQLQYLKLARECYGYISKHFWDQKYGGVYWSVSTDGHPEDSRKKTYAQVFFIYGLSEFYKCYPTPAILDQCTELFLQLERHAFDKDNLGYYEVCERDWAVAEDQRLSDKDMDEKKSMNTHLHILEAFTNLCSIRDDNLLKYRLTMLLEIFREKIIQPGTDHLGLFFDDAWQPRSKGISFGHEIEASWLIYEAAEVLDDRELLSRYEHISSNLAKKVFAKGLDPSGGLNYEIDEQSCLDTDKHFWVQAEAVVGFLNAYQITGQESYLDTVVSVWQFIQQYLVDKVYGEWFWKVDGKGVPDGDLPKICDWKGPYHNVRACIEVINRIDALLTQNNEQKGKYTYGQAL